MGEGDPAIPRVDEPGATDGAEKNPAVRFAGVEDVWRRSGIPVAALEKLADADGFASLGVTRREALWIIRGLSDAPLPLFEAFRDNLDPPEHAGFSEGQARLPPPPLRGRDGEGGSDASAVFAAGALPEKNTPLPPLRGDLPLKGGGGERPASLAQSKEVSDAALAPASCPDLIRASLSGEEMRGSSPRMTPATGENFTEPSVNLPKMSAGAEVVEDYRSIGLTLRAHPVSFLRPELARKGMVPAAALAAMRNGRRTKLAGLVLVRQKPGSAKGVMFITLEDETGIANLVVWPSLFERQRRVVLQSAMMGVEGKVQRAGEVIHIVAERLHDLSPMLRSIGERDEPFTVPTTRGDEAKGGGAPDARGDLGRKPRDIYIPDLRYEGIRPKSRNFR